MAKEKRAAHQAEVARKEQEAIAKQQFQENYQKQHGIYMGQYTKDTMARLGFKDVDEEEVEAEVQDNGEDEMEVDKDFAPVGIDLTRVDWDKPILRALLAIDTAIVVPDVSRPDPDRTEWMASKYGVKLIVDRMDDLIACFESQSFAD